MAAKKHKSTVLITGASGGIGMELAEVFARNGHNLVLVARSEDKLYRLAMRYATNYKVYAKVIAADLSDPAAPQRLFDELKQANMVVDVLVNNAGVGNYGPFRETNLQKELDMLQLNVVALTHLSKLFLYQLPAGTPGKILNVSSVAAFLSGPYMAIYYASKAYVLSFSEAIKGELEKHNVTVTTLCPGPTDTDFKERANLDSSSRFSAMFKEDAREVAEAGYTGLMKGENIVLPGLKNKALPHLLKLVPRSILRNMVLKIQESRQ
ncbi:SDR family oxidoreductase [Pontibacter sp. SGAir0037]|uniref:SDR family NAD(P)-dependent oxidoreductase n=1 Tax=Pontibacter sp. SGAir0037 TaxID=2571030 RepID=UPI0010CD22BC|nr:SDR family oxidoreductase [Pontibacter sp. SGAir0037]QCR23719.1 short-chain dehydrogenase [Pontibacter sp. SGAir0037]